MQASPPHALARSFRPPDLDELAGSDPEVLTDLLSLGVRSADLLPLLLAACERRATLLIGPAGSRFVSVMQRVRDFLGPLPPVEQWASNHLMTRVGREPSPAWKAKGPLRAPHYTASPKALFSADAERPGELALASWGILYLDNLEYFPPRNVKLLTLFARKGYVVEGEGQETQWLPATAWVVGARNHCYCGCWDAGRTTSAPNCSCDDAAMTRFADATDAIDPHFEVCFELRPVGG